MHAHSIAQPRELSGREIDQVNGGISGNQIKVLVVAGPVGLVFWGLARGLFGQDPIHW